MLNMLIYRKFGLYLQNHCTLGRDCLLTNFVKGPSPDKVVLEQTLSKDRPLTNPDKV
jgi:hypothetical protein